MLGTGGDIPRKPDPAGAWMCARALGVEASRIVYVGDSGIDMQTARKLRMYPVGVTWGSGAERNWKQTEPPCSLTSGSVAPTLGLEQIGQRTLKVLLDNLLNDCPWLSCQAGRNGCFTKFTQTPVVLHGNWKFKTSRPAPTPAPKSRS